MYYFFRKDTQQFVYALPSNHDDRRDEDLIVVEGSDELERKQPYLKLEGGKVVVMADDEIKSLRLDRSKQRALKDIDIRTKISITKGDFTHNEKNFSLSENAQLNWLRRAQLAAKNSKATFEVTTTDDNSVVLSSKEVLEVVKTIEDFIGKKLREARLNKQAIKSKTENDDVIEHMILNGYIEEKHRRHWENY